MRPCPEQCVRSKVFFLAECGFGAGTKKAGKLGELGELGAGSGQRQQVAGTQAGWLINRVFQHSSQGSYGKLSLRARARTMAMRNWRDGGNAERGASKGPIYLKCQEC